MPRDTMDEFVRSMSVVLTRMLAKEETLEQYVKTDNKTAALAEIDNLIRETGGLIEAFSHQIAP